MAGQSVGELFVDLGIKGAEKTIGALQATREGFAGLTSMSLEAKAAIIGAFYALEQLFTSSGRFGIAQTNAKTLIGETGKSIQQYENDAQRLGIANGAMTQTLLKLKQAMVDLKFKGTAPEGMFWIHSVLGDVKPSDIDKYIQHPGFLFQRLREYALKEKVPGLALDRLKSFIPDQNMIARMMQGHLGEDEISKSPYLSSATIARLEKTGEAWNKLGVDIDLAFHHFASFHGKEIADQIDKLIPPIVKLADNLERISRNVGVFKLLGQATEGMGIATPSAEEQRKAFHQGHGDPARQSLLDFVTGGLRGAGSARGSVSYHIQNEISLHGIGPLSDASAYTWGKVIGDELAKHHKKALNNYDQSTVK